MSRAFINKLFASSTWIAITISMGTLLFLLGVIIWNGLPAINWEFLSLSSKNFGAEGGVYYQILGSLLLVATSAIISFPIALGTAIYKSEYISSKRWQKITDLFIYGLNGVPSIIYGIFGLIFFLSYLNFDTSWFVGAIILAILILPIITLSAYLALNMIPISVRESAQALGLNKWQIISKVLLPQAINGAVTGLLIGLSRAIGETAPIMFIATAFSGVTFPTSINEPVLSLPTHILALSQQTINEQALENAWGSSFILLVIVMIFSSSALLFRSKK